MDSTYLLIIYSSFFIGTGVFSFLINALLLKFARTLGIRNPSDSVIRWSTAVKPALGGITFFIVFLLSVACYSIFFQNSNVLLNRQVLGLLGACAISFLIGLADDAYDTKPFLKFLAQVICGLILISSGISIHLFQNEIINNLLTVFWVVGIMNSINMLDNMDGITATVSASIILAALLILYLNQDLINVHIIIMLGVLASLFAFLYFNWHPSKMFMGDTGSQFLGLFLAAIGIIYFWNTSDSSGAKVQSKQFIVTILTFIIPITDTTVVVINRLSKGKSPFIGGKDHTTHHLSYAGLSDKRVALSFALISIISMLFTIFIIKFIHNWSYLHIFIFGGYFILLFSILFYITRTKKGPTIAKIPSPDERKAAQ